MKGIIPVADDHASGPDLSTVFGRKPEAPFLVPERGDMDLLDVGHESRA